MDILLSLSVYLHFHTDTLKVGSYDNKFTAESVRLSVCRYKCYDIEDILKSINLIIVYGDIIHNPYFLEFSLEGTPYFGKKNMDKFVLYGTGKKMSMVTRFGPIRQKNTFFDVS